MTAPVGMDWFIYHLRTDQYALYTDMPQFTRHCFSAPSIKTLINSLLKYCAQNSSKWIDKSQFLHTTINSEVFFTILVSCVTILREWVNKIDVRKE